MMMILLRRHDLLYERIPYVTLQGHEHATVFERVGLSCLAVIWQSTLVRERDRLYF